jgi:hypothetical protein
MQKTAGVLPQFDAGVAACQTTTPSNCKILQYRGDRAAEGSVTGNTITIDVGAKTGFGVPIDGTKLYSVTAFTFGRNNSVDDPVRGRRRDAAVRLRARVGEVGEVRRVRAAGQSRSSPGRSR